MARKHADADDGDDEAGHDQRPLRPPLRQALARRATTSSRPTVAAVKITPVWIGVVAAHHLQVGRDHERHPHQHQPLDVLGDQAEVRRAVAEQRRRQQRLPARPLLGAHVTGRTRPAPARRRRSGRASARRCCRPRGCPTRAGPGPTADSTAPPDVERPVGSAGSGSSTCRLSTTITTMTSAWKTNAARQLIAEVMRPPISGPAAAPIPPDRADRAERPGPRRDLGEQQRGEDVDGRDQQRGADALEDRVAEDEHAEPGGDRADQRADAVDDQPDGEAAACGRTGRSACRRGSSARP